MHQRPGIVHYLFDYSPDMEYLAADFYLETVRLVFHDHALLNGESRFRGRLVDPAAIRRTALLTVESEHDDICALRAHCVQPDVGHYGVFSGMRRQTHIYPVARDVIHVSG